MKSFISEFMDYSKDLESPSSFFYWSALATVAAVVRDNVYQSYGPKNLYPNIYVLLLAESAIARKSVPSGLSCDLLLEIRNTKVIRGRTSIQAILQDLSDSWMDKQTGKTITGGSCFLCAEELASFFVADPSAVPILTDIYDFRAEWGVNLKIGGKAKIKNLCVTLLAASNEVHLREVYSILAVRGGLMRRTFFVKADERRKANSLYGRNGNFVDYSKDDLVIMLRAISELKGEFKIEADAKHEYDEWYTALHAKYSIIADENGVIGGIHTSVAKVAMLLAIGHEYDLVIRKHHVEEAVYQCTKLLPNYNLLTLSSGKATIAVAGSILFNDLFNAEKRSITHREFLRLHWTEIDSEILKQTVDTFEQAGLIASTMDLAGSNVVYTLTEAGYEKLKFKMEGKKI